MAGRILVLDDEENYARMVLDLLRYERYNVDMATKPQVALERLQNESFDLVISDYKMPLMDGTQFLAEARKLKPELPVIMVSGLMNTPELLRAANTGVTLVLEKPFDTQVFLSYVKRFVEPEPESAAPEEAPADTPQTDADGQVKEISAYPRPLRIFSDQSEPSKQFMQALWQRCQETHVIFVQAPKGAEFELAVREVSVWKSGAAKRPTFLSATQVKTAQLPERMRGIQIDPEASAVIGVNDFDDLPDDQQEYVLQLFKAAIDIPGNKRLYLVFRVANAEYGQIRDGAEPTETQVEIGKELVRLSPLKDRLPDLAMYARRYLKLFAHAERRPARGELAVEAVRVILGYEWPGNFIELTEVLHRAVLLGPDGPVTADELEGVLFRLYEKAPPNARGGGLKQYLHRRQRAYMLTVKRQLGGGTAALGAMGVDPGRVKPGQMLEDLDLLVPELLRA